MPVSGKFTWLWSYGLAVLLIGVATILSLLLAQLVERAIFILFHAAVVITTWRGGLRAGLLAIILSALTSAYFLLPPPLSFEIGLQGLAQVITFVLVALLIVLLVGGRRQAEAALTEREKQLRLIIDAAPALISYIGADLCYRFNNRTYESWFGRSQTEMSGLHVRDVLGEAAYQTLRPHFEAVLAGQQVSYEQFAPYQSGERYIQATYTPDIDEQGQVQGFVVLVNDITERKQTEESLQLARAEAEQVQARLERILAGIKDDFVMYDHDWRYVYVNDRAAQTLGYAKEQLVGQRIWDLFPAAVGNLFYQKLHQAVAEGREIAFEFYYEPFDKWFENRAYPISDGLLLFTTDITERKRNEQQLTEQARLLDLSNDTIFVRDVNGCVTFWNRGAVESYGYTREEAMGKVTHELLQTVFPEPLEHINKKLRRQGYWSGELIHTRKDGSKIIVMSRWALDRDAQGNPTSTLETNNDITERKQAEELLRQSANQLALITDTAPVFIARCSREERFLFVNKSYAERLGLRPEDCIGKRIPEVLGLEAYESFRQYVEIVLRGQPVKFEVEVPYAAIGKHFMHCSYAPEFDSNGEVVGWVSAITDISERRKMEDTLRESEERFRNMADHAPVMIWVTEADMTCTYLSQSWYKFTGQTPKTHLDFGWIGAVHPDDRTYTKQTFIAANERREAFRLEYRLRRWDGEYRWAIDSAAPRFGPDGRFLGYIGSVIDITERKQAELAQHLLAEASEVLIASTSYETALSNLARLIVPHLADWCVVDLIGEDGLIHRLAVVHRDPAKMAAAAQLQRRYLVLDPQSEHTITKMLRRGQSWFDAEVSETRLAAEARDAEHLQLLRDLGFASEMVVLLTARGRTLGALTLVRASGERRYEAADLALAEELARRATIVVDNARLYEAEQQARKAAEQVTQRIASLQAVTARLATALTPADVVQVVLEEGLPALDSDAGSVVWLDGEEMEIVGTTGFPEAMTRPWRRFPLSTSTPIAEAARTGQSIWLESPEEFQQRYGRLPNPATLAISQSWGALPLVAYGRVLGALGLSYPKPQIFHPDSQRFAETLADLCAQALERARLYQEMQQLNAELEERVAQRTAELERSIKELDQFTYIASHDLKAPLRGVKQLSTWIVEDAGNVLPESSKVHLDKMQGRIQRMEKLLDDLLMYSRVGRNYYGSIETVDTGVLIKEIIDLLAPPPTFVFIVQEDMPTLTTSRMLLELVFKNLIENAIKHHHRIDGQIQVSASDRGDFIEFSVTDDGPGIDEKFHERIFQIFQTLQPRTKVESTGVGLSIVKKAIENQGGRINIISAGGQGATFLFTWPKNSDSYQNG